MKIDMQTRKVLIIALVAGAGVAALWWIGGSVSDGIKKLFGSITGKEGTSSTTIPDAPPAAVAQVSGGFVDPIDGVTALVSAGGNTYPMTVALKSDIEVTGNVRIETTEKPIFDKAQTFVLNHVGVTLPAGKMVVLKGDMSSMSLADAPISALVGRGAVARLYFNDEKKKTIVYSVTTAFA